MLTQRIRRGLLVVLAVFAVLLTSGCVDVTTTLQLNDDKSGKRIMTATLPKSDLADKNVDLAKAIQTLKSSKPEGMEIGELQDAGDHWKLDFVVAFSSPEDYAAKVKTILASYPDSYATNELQWEVVKSPLVNGLVYNEAWTTSDLLGWIPGALDKAKLAPDQSFSGMFGDTNVGKITWAKKSYDVAYGSLRVDDVLDDGFTEALVSITEGDGFDVEIALAEQTGGDNQAQAQRAQRLQQYLDSVMPDGGKAERREVDGQGMWVVQYHAGDAAGVVAGMDKVFSTDSAALETAERSEPTELTKIYKDVAVKLDASQILSPNQGRSTSVTYVADQAWTAENQTSELGNATEFSASGEPLDARGAFIQQIPIGSVAVETSLALGGEVDQRVSFLVPKSSADRIGDSLTSALTPPEGIGTVEKQESGDTVTFTAVIKGKDAAELNKKLASYLPGSYLEVTGVEGMWPDYHVTSFTDLSSIGLDEGITGEVKSSVVLPSMHGFQEGTDQSVSIDGKTATFTSEASPQISISVGASGPTMGGLIGIGVLVGVLLLVVALAIVFRKQLAAAMKKATAAAQAAAAEQRRRAAEAAAAAAQSGEAVGVGGPVMAQAAGGPAVGAPPQSARPNGPWPVTFTEHDLY